MAEVKISVKNVVEGQNDVPKAAKNYETLNKNINTLAKSMGAVIAAGATFKKAFDLSREGASLTQLESSFNLLNKQVLHTPGLLDAMSDAARGTIKETQLMAGVLTLTAGQSAEMAQQFAAASPQLIEIAKAAQKLNPTLGDTGFLYNSLATGIKRSSPLILDNLGIVVKVGEANKKYADSIGKSVEELTAQEKQIALLNATLDAGNTLIEQVGGNVDSQTDAWDRLTVQVGSATDAFKQNLAEGLGPWVKLINGDYARAIREIEEGNLRAAESTGDYTKANTASKAGYDAVIASILRTSESYNEFLEKLDEAGIATVNVRTDLVGMNEAWFENKRRVEEVTQVQTQLNEQMELHADRLAASLAETENVTDATKAYGWSLEGVKSNYQGLYQSGFERFSDDLIEQKEASREAAEAIREQQQEIRALADAQAAAAQAEFAQTFTSALDGQRVAFGQWVTTATAVGGLTEEQQTNFDELSKKAVQLRDNIRSLQGGTDGLGLTEEQLNDKLAKNYEQLGLVEGAIANLGDTSVTYTDVQKKWVVDAEALNNTLFDQITANEDDEVAIAAAGLALGLYDKTQVEAALNAAIINREINALAEAFVNGELTAGQMKERMDEIVANSPYTSEVAVLVDDAMASVQKVRTELDKIPRHIESKVTVTTEYKDSGPPPGSGAGAGGGQAPGRAVGGPVMANQPYFVHANEVFIPPTAGKIASTNDTGMGGDVNISFAGAIFQGTTQQQARQITTMVAEQLGKLQ